MWNSWRGYVIIRVDAPRPELFLNRVLKKGIHIWDIRREGRSYMYASMRVRDFSKLRSVCRGISCRVHISERHGMPFQLARFRHRKILVLGSALLLCACVALGQRMWFVQIDGCYRVSETDVLRILEEAGVAVGTSRAALDLPQLRDELRAGDGRIAWAGAELTGVVLHVQIVEAEPVPELPDTSEPANVVAVKDGVILRVTALEGQAAVRAGDAVHAGDTLIKGQMRHGNVYAQGEVLAEVCYTAQSTLAPTARQFVRTGRTADYYAVRVMGVLLNESECPFAQGEMEPELTSTMQNLFPPLSVARGIWYETALADVRFSEEELLAEALYRAELKALDLVPHSAAITGKTSSVSVSPNGSVTVRVSVYTRENIGTTQKIK